MATTQTNKDTPGTSGAEAEPSSASTPTTKRVHHAVVTPLPPAFSIVHESSSLIAQPALDSAVIKATMGLGLHAEKAQRRKEILGMAAMVLSSLFFTSMTLGVKISFLGHFGSFEIVFSRSVIQLVLSLLACLVLRINPLGPHGIRRWLLLRGIFMALGLSLFFYSLTTCPLVEAIGLFFLGPVFTYLLGAIWLDNRLTAWDCLYTLMSILGVVLIMQPGLFVPSSPSMTPPPSFLAAIAPTTSARQWGHVCALAGAAMSAMAFLTIRKIGRTAHFLVHSVYFGIMSMLISLPGWFVFQRWLYPSPDTNQLPIVALGLVGVFAFAGQCFLHLGLKWAPAGLGLLSHNTDIVFALFAGWAVLHEIPDSMTWMGAIIIAVATTAFAMHQLKLRAIHVATIHATRKRKSRERLYTNTTASSSED
ncbi:hypothetical protein BC940DRAFT_306906 [Gongronella butleri]|nr:hypothetical protein BC940DRAFT_306906 [Gongronella butleri]